MDDYASAAARHFSDAEKLAAEARYDNAGHLMGFAVECAIKTKLRELLRDPEMRCEGHHPKPQKELLRLLQNRGMTGPWLAIANDRKLLKNWSVDDRYSADGTVTEDSYREWLANAQKVLSVASIKKKVA